ncbi:MAG TPA: hypothetical protein VMV64_08050 [Sulfuricella sp.]|nr:hypothetical protein [Sulfuricella sp.]HUX63686.1 hypothetical protein [Sulfuricella sp.]
MQRPRAAGDPRPQPDEEKEHAAVVLEWIRCSDPIFDKELRNYLFTDKQIAHE